jgi:hypothetical protein
LSSLPKIKISEIFLAFTLSVRKLRPTISKRVSSRISRAPSNPGMTKMVLSTISNKIQKEQGILRRTFSMSFLNKPSNSTRPNTGLAQGARRSSKLILKKFSDSSKKQKGSIMRIYASNMSSGPKTRNKGKHLTIG